MTIVNFDRGGKRSDSDLLTDFYDAMARLERLAPDALNCDDFDAALDVMQDIELAMREARASLRWRRRKRASSPSR